MIILVISLPGSVVSLPGSAVSLPWSAVSLRIIITRDLPSGPPAPFLSLIIPYLGALFPYLRTYKLAKKKTLKNAQNPPKIAIYMFIDFDEKQHS